MTRLKTEWIEHMLCGMDDYNGQLKEKTGMNLVELMMNVFNLDKETLQKARQNNKIAVIPITQGGGIIGSFSQSVAAIIEAMGFDTAVMDHTDVDGIYDASLEGRNILFFADDARYLALNTLKVRAADNNYATALGFIQVLKALMKKNGKDIYKEKILQIGYGIVGREAVKILVDEGIDFDIYDKNSYIIMDLPYNKLEEKGQIKNYNYILDFTNEGGWLEKEDLDPATLYASPGVPYSMDEKAANCFEDKAVHDNLEIGTAIMLGQAIIS